MNTGLHRPKQPDLVRARIIDACAELLADGHGLSIGSVADAADVTKGAVQHHFGTRAELLMAFYEQVLLDMEKEINTTKAENSAESYVIATFNLLPNSKENLRHRALLAACVNELEVAQEWSNWVEESRKDDNQSINKLIARLASDGLWLSKILGTYKLSENENDQLKTILKNLAK